jgi:hypothetical protein
MTRAAWEIVSKLPNHPTPKHPLGQRTAVLERSAILHFEAGVPFPEADERALVLEGVVAPRLPGVDR